MSDTSARACSCSRRRVRFFAPAIFSAALLTWSLPLAANPPSQPNTVPDLAQLEIQMWRLINRDRGAPSSLEETRGLARPLQWDDRWAAAARASTPRKWRVTDSSAIRGSTAAFLTCESPVREFSGSSVGENLAEFPDVVQAEAAFMNEPEISGEPPRQHSEPWFHACGGRNRARGRWAAVHHSGFR